MLWVRFQPCTLAVQAMSVLPFQKPTVSPNHCGTCCTCLRPIRTAAQEVAGGTGEELHLVRVHHDLEHTAGSGLRPPPHQPFRIAERRTPLRGVADRLVILLLYEALLVLQASTAAPGCSPASCRHRSRHRPTRCERKIRPTSAATARCVGRATALFRLGQQRVVMLLGGLVREGTDDLLDRGCRCRNHPRTPAGCRRDCDARAIRRIAPGIPLVGPVLSVEVEVLAREHVHRQGRDAGRRRGGSHGASALPRARVPRPGALRASATTVSAIAIHTRATVRVRFM